MCRSTTSATRLHRGSPGHSAGWRPVTARRRRRRRWRGTRRGPACWRSVSSAGRTWGSSLRSTTTEASRRPGEPGASRGSSLDAGVLSAAFGQGPDGSAVVAFGLSDGTVRIVDPRPSGRRARWRNRARERRHRDQSDPQVRRLGRWVGLRSGLSNDGRAQHGRDRRTAALGWDVQALTALPVTADSPGTITSDWDAFRTWYPGIKQGRFHVTNASAEPIAVTLVAAPDSASGCWYAPTWPDARRSRRLASRCLPGRPRRSTRWAPTPQVSTAARGDEQQRHLAWLSGRHPGEPSR